MKITNTILVYTIYTLSLPHLVVGQYKGDSLDLKIAQMIMVGVPDVKVNEKIADNIQQGKIGGIILFEKNIRDEDSYIQFKKMIYTYQKMSTTPLFIAIDQEGGKVNRLKTKYGFPRTISAKSMSVSLDSVQFYSEVISGTLAGLGINVNFAPVVDLAVNETNPVIAKANRAFSDNPVLVTQCAQLFIEAHQKVNVITVLKHFPGHGSSVDDTHLGIADVTNTWTEKEIFPYQKLIEMHSVDAIMSAHIVNRHLDKSGRPGTLSYNMVNELLRTRLDYKGVVFSDDMQMHAITQYYGLEDAIKLAIEAGIDVLLFSNNIDENKTRTVDNAHHIIRGLVEKNIIDEKRITDSFNRISALKKKYLFAPCSITEKSDVNSHTLLQKGKNDEKSDNVYPKKKSTSRKKKKKHGD